MRDCALPYFISDSKASNIPNQMNKNSLLRNPSGPKGLNQFSPSGSVSLGVGIQALKQGDFLGCECH